MGGSLFLMGCGLGRYHILAEHGQSMDRSMDSQYKRHTEVAFSLKLAYQLFQHLRLNCNPFLCLLITALCCYGGGSSALLFLMGGTMIEHGQEHGQLINKASGGRPLSEIWHISYFNVSGYAAILFYAFCSLRCATCAVMGALISFLMGCDFSLGHN
jgi:hypothetical protein